MNFFFSLPDRCRTFLKFCWNFLSLRFSFFAFRLIKCKLTIVTSNRAFERSWCDVRFWECAHEFRQLPEVARNKMYKDFKWSKSCSYKSTNAFLPLHALANFCMASVIVCLADRFFFEQLDIELLDRVLTEQILSCFFRSEVSQSLLNK